MASDNGEHGPWGTPPTPPEKPRASVPGSDRPNPNRPNPGRATPGPNWPGSGGAPGPRLDQFAQTLRDRFTGSGGGGWFGGPPGGHRHLWLSGARGAALMGLVIAALWLASGFYRVEPDEAGVVQRFGRFVRLTPPGLNYHLPWPVESVQLPSVTRINRIEIGYRSPGNDPDADPDTTATDPNGIRQIPAESLMLTGDENIIDIDFAVFWRIRNAADFTFATRNPEATIKEVSESVMREVIGRTPIEPALTDARARIEADVLAKSQSILDHYGSGVELSQVQLQKVDPPAEVIDSFRDVQRANTEAERMVNEAQSYSNNIVPRARGDAATIVAAGQGAQSATVARAEGETKAFLSVLAAYQQAKDITLDRLYIETMEDLFYHAPATVVDGGLKNLLPVLPLTTPGGHITVTDTTGAEPAEAKP